MQFQVLALAFAAMASVASAETVTVYECSATPTTTPAGVASSTAGPVASTGGVIYPTSSPIPPFTGGATANGVSALGLIIAGGVALFL